MPFLWLQRGADFEHARLAALMALVLGQVLTVPLGLVVGLGLAVAGRWARTPGHVLGAVTTVFGVVVIALARSTDRWIEGRPSGIGDPDGEYAMVMFALLSGVVTVLVGLAIVAIRWARYDEATVPARRPRSRGRARKPAFHPEPCQDQQTPSG